MKTRRNGMDHEDMKENGRSSDKLDELVGYPIRDDADGQYKFVIAENIADACDALEALGMDDCAFLHTTSFQVVANE